MQSQLYTRLTCKSRMQPHDTHNITLPNTRLKSITSWKLYEQKCSPNPPPFLLPLTQLWEDINCKLFLGGPAAAMGRRGNRQFTKIVSLPDTKNSSRRPLLQTELQCRIIGWNIKKQKDPLVNHLPNNSDMRKWINN